ncbi:MAG: YtcA family lipoprotein [Caulobacteraceae bacterium]
MKNRKAGRRRLAALTPALFAVSGCALRGAPDFALFGSYFPAWMFCALIGIFGAIAARVIIVLSGLAQVLPLQLFVCASAGLCCALLAWLLWFGQ